MCPWHFALPASPVCGKCFLLAKSFGVGSGRRLRIAFRPRRLLPKKATRGGEHALKVPRLRDETQPTDFVQARHGEFVLWRTAKTLIDSASQVTAAWRLPYRGLRARVPCA